MKDPSRSTLVTVIVLGTVFVLGYLLGAANTRRAITRGTFRTAAVPTGAPRLTPQETAYDFGSVAHDGEVRHAFRITNDGGADLIIRGVEASCGCTVAAPSSTVVGPGMSADIEVTFNAKKQHGDVDKEIEVESNDPSSEITLLHIKGHVREPGESASPSTNLAPPSGAPISPKAVETP